MVKIFTLIDTVFQTTLHSHPHQQWLTPSPLTYLIYWQCAVIGIIYQNEKVCWWINQKTWLALIFVIRQKKSGATTVMARSVEYKGRNWGGMWGRRLGVGCSRTPTTRFLDKESLFASPTLKNEGYVKHWTRLIQIWFCSVAVRYCLIVYKSSNAGLG